MEQVLIGFFDHTPTKTKNKPKKSAIVKLADKDEEIRRHQPPFPAAASSCPVNQILPSNFEWWPWRWWWW
jgi:hypothetical protein